MNQQLSYPRHLPTSLRPGQAVGVCITLRPDVSEALIAQFEGWFAHRAEVAIVDAGTSDKAGLGFLILEWRECDIDPLFLTILQQEDAVGDYAIYSRAL